MQHRHRNPQPFLTETPAHSTTTTLPKPDQPPAAASPQAECHTPLPLTEPLPQHQDQQVRALLVLTSQPHDCSKLPDQEGWFASQRSLKTLAFTRKHSSWIVSHINNAYTASQEEHFYYNCFPFSYLWDTGLHLCQISEAFLFCIFFWFGEGGCHVTVALLAIWLCHVFWSSRMNSR